MPNRGLNCHCTVCGTSTSAHHMLVYGTAGIVPIAHNSGGPKMDIIVENVGASGAAQRGRVGYLCSSEEEYAQAITEVLAMDQVDRLQIASAARRCSTTSIFSIQSCLLEMMSGP